MEELLWCIDRRGNTSAAGTAEEEATSIAEGDPIPANQTFGLDDGKVVLVQGPSVLPPSGDNAFGQDALSSENEQKSMSAATVQIKAARSGDARGGALQPPQSVAPKATRNPIGDLHNKAQRNHWKLEMQVVPPAPTPAVGRTSIIRGKGELRRASPGVTVAVQINSERFCTAHAANRREARRLAADKALSLLATGGDHRTLGLTPPTAALSSRGGASAEVSSPPSALPPSSRTGALPAIATVSNASLAGHTHRKTGSSNAQSNGAKALSDLHELAAQKGFSLHWWRLPAASAPLCDAPGMFSFFPEIDGELYDVGSAAKKQRAKQLAAVSALQALREGRDENCGAGLRRETERINLTVATATLALHLSMLARRGADAGLVAATFHSPERVAMASFVALGAHSRVLSIAASSASRQQADSDGEHVVWLSRRALLKTLWSALPRTSGPEAAPGVAHTVQRTADRPRGESGELLLPDSELYLVLDRLPREEGIGNWIRDVAVWCALGVQDHSLRRFVRPVRLCGVCLSGMDVQHSLSITAALRFTLQRMMQEAPSLSSFQHVVILSRQEAVLDLPNTLPASPLLAPRPVDDGGKWYWLSPAMSPVGHSTNITSCEADDADLSTADTSPGLVPPPAGRPYSAVDAGVSDPQLDEMFSRHAHRTGLDVELVVAADNQLRSQIVLQKSVAHYTQRFPMLESDDRSTSFGGGGVGGSGGARAGSAR